MVIVVVKKKTKGENSVNSENLKEARVVPVYPLTLILSLYLAVSISKGRASSSGAWLCLCVLIQLSISGRIPRQGRPGRRR